MLTPLLRRLNGFAAEHLGVRLVRAVVCGRRYRDPVVQRHGIDPVHLHLFEPG
jgi:hypothetical protein